MRKLIPALTALLLLLPAVAVAADGATHATDNPGSEVAASKVPDFAQQWKDLKTALASPDNLTEAREIYNSTFAEGAARAPAAQAAIEAGLTAAENTTDELVLAAAQQQVDKSLYAVALANVEHFLLEGNASVAQAWFGLLDAKFGDAVAEAADAVALANETNGVQVAATVRANVQDVTLAKVFKEVVETPLVLADGDVLGAVKEAAEGRYYYLSTRDAVLDTLGPDAEAELVEALDHLLEEAMENEVVESEEIAESILAVLAEHAVLSASSVKADTWSEMKGLVKSRTAENLTAAEALYEREFAEAAARLAPASAERMVQNFEKARADLEAEDEVGFALAKQTLDKALYDVAFQATLEALDNGNPDAALEWYKLLATKLKFLGAVQDNAHLLELGKAAAANGNADAARPVVVDGTVSVLLDKVEGEIEATLSDWDAEPVHSHETAIEAVLYYEPARTAVAAVIGADSEHEIHHELEEFLEARIAGNESAAEHAGGEIVALLGQYRAETMKNADLAKIVPRLIPTLNLIVEEYEEYFYYLEKGETAQAEAEIVEAHTFNGNVRRTIEKQLDIFEAADADATAQVFANLDTVTTQLDELVPFEDLEATVADTKAILLGLAGMEAPAGEGEDNGMAGEVTLKFGEATLDGDTYVVPVFALGLPGGGSAYDLRIAYDASQVTVQKVEAFSDIPQAKVEDGTVRLLGAFTGDAAAEAKIAEMRVQPADGVTEATFEVHVDILADAANRELGLSEVEGATVTFSEGDDNEADVSGDSTTRESPFPAAALLVAAFGAIALVARRKEA